MNFKLLYYNTIGHHPPDLRIYIGVLLGQSTRLIDSTDEISKIRRKDKVLTFDNLKYSCTFYIYTI